MPNIQGTLLVSDLDGTLLTPDKQAHPRDLEAVRRFREAGGAFTIATGRSIPSALPYVERFEVTLPVILHNGAMLYDYTAKRVLWSTTLPETAREYVRKIMEACPYAGTELLVADDILVPRFSPEVEKHLFVEEIGHTACPLEEASDSWVKVLFAMEPSLADELERYVESQDFPGVRFVRSDDKYYEMLPLDADKGQALTHLKEAAPGTYTRVAAIGDYNNDLGMLEAADIAFAPETAIEAVRNIARHIVCSNSEGAVADAISRLLDKA